MDVLDSLITAWNWTTGRQKNDLATCLTYSGTIGIVSMLYHQYGPQIGTIMIPASIGFAKINQKRYEQTHILENETNAEGPLLELESKKTYHKLSGAYWAGLSTLYSLGNNPTGTVSTVQLSLAELVMMSPTNPPRRKNVISRSVAQLDTVIRQRLPKLQQVSS